ncbi:hypothetical protein ACVINI_005069 [Rhizobium beringeri]
MPKPISRAYSHYSRDALLVFSQLIRRARIERKLTTQELADRACNAFNGDIGKQRDACSSSEVRSAVLYAGEG